jgi:hypothetical protein
MFRHYQNLIKQKLQVMSSKVIEANLIKREIEKLENDPNFVPGKKIDRYTIDQGFSTFWYSHTPKSKF